MSPDGYVAGPHDEVDQVFKWYFSGDATHEVSSGDQVFKISEEGADMIREGGQAAGVLVTARRTFDIAHAWGGKHPMNVPVVIVTYDVPFDHLGIDPADLKIIEVSANPGGIHITYAVVK